MRNLRRVPRTLLASVFTGYWLMATGYSDDRIIDRQVIDPDLPGGYQVEVADVNGDKRPDIVALGGSTCAWYENPTWRKRIVTSGGQSPGIISTATADLDGDGKAEIAIAYEFAMNEPTRGKLALAVQEDGAGDAWKLIPVADLGSIHRLRWGDIDGDTKPDLIVAPIFGPRAKPPAYDDGALIVAFRPQGDPKSGVWGRTPLIAHRVIHAIEVRPLPAIQGRAAILTADNEGITLLGEGMITDGPSFTLTSRNLVPGAAGPAPKRGCSEVHLGRLRGDRHFLATVEPWHGTDVVVWPEVELGAFKFGARVVLDTTLADGHALWVADIDGDGDDEVFAGHRGKDHRVAVYDRDSETGKWNRTVIDRDIAAQDLRGGDIDGDGRPDVVAVGGSTHNVVLYRSRRP